MKFKVFICTAVFAAMLCGNVYCAETAPTNETNATLEAYANVTVDGLTFRKTYDSNQNECYALEKASYTGASVTIPSEVEGLPVISIASSAFRDITQITSVTIPEGITEIGWNAFNGCTHLKEVNLPNTLETLGAGAFKGCTSLTSVIIPPKVTVIESSCFQNCINLASVTIPQKVTVIGSYCFRDCTALQEATLPSGLTTIDEGAFYGSGLKSINIPSTVTTIGPCAFYKCASFSGEVDLSNLKEIGVSAFCECKDLHGDIDISNVEQLGGGAFAETNIRSLKLPDNISVIPDSLCQNCSSLESVNIPSTVTKFEGGCFENCSSLKHIDIPDGVTEIEYNAFKYCSELETVDFPDSIVSFGSNAFYGCSKFTRLHIPANCTSIDFNYPTFWKMPKLEEITIGEGNTTYSVLSGVLYNKDMTELLLFPESKSGELIMPENLTTMADMRPEYITSLTLSSAIDADHIDFAYFTNLAEIKVPAGNPYLCSIDGVLFTKDKKNIVAYPPKRTVDTYVIPEGTETLYPYGFDLAEITNLVIPASVKEIDQQPFGLGSYIIVGLKTVTFYGDVPQGFISPMSFSSVPVDEETGMRSYSKDITMYYDSTKSGWAELILECSKYANTYTWIDINNMQSFTYGSATGNDNLSAADSASILQKVLNNSYKMPLEEKTDNYLKYLDVNLDNQLTAADSAIVLQKVLNSAYKMPIELQTK